MYRPTHNDLDTFNVSNDLEWSWEQYLAEYYRPVQMTPPEPPRHPPAVRYCENCREHTAHRRGICRECGASWRESQGDGRDTR